MREVIRYEAEDGSVWALRLDAMRRDALVAECDVIVDELGLRERPSLSGCQFENGHGHLQQPAGSRARLLAYLQSKGVTRDTDGPLATLLHRVYCMDEADREWGQPYFASHPEKASNPDPLPTVEASRG
jgi:hypothetical protein